MGEPYRLTASGARDQIRLGALTVEDYAKSLLSRISRRDSIVRAWAHFDPDFVLKQARDLDQIPAEQRGPLHGVAVGVKDVIYTKDMPTQHNSSIYTDSAPRVDAGSVMILRHAGALIFGKTTTTEFAATVVGTATCNPHDPTRTPGGSSSGSGAAVGDYQVPLALGTQTGGSVIRPASFNGVYAMKPTWGSVTREGQKVYSLILDTVGWYGRCVADLEMLADVFALRDDGEEPAEMTEDDFRNSKVALVKTMVWPQVGPGTAAAMNTAARILRERGVIVEEIELPPEFDELPQQHRIVLTCDGRTAFLPEYYADKPRLHESLVGHVDNVKRYTRAQQLAAFDCISVLRPKIDEIAGRYSVIIAPSVPDEAPVGQTSTGSAAFNSIWTALHTPVVNIPGFKGEHGMPIGLSLIAPRYRDRHLLKVAKVIGKIFETNGGWAPSI